jgi:hypothetical protein
MSREVSWWAVHQFVEPFLMRVAEWPLAGSVEWELLEDHDERKMAALLDAAQHHALRVDTAQAALVEAAQAVHSAADWDQVRREVNELRDAGKSGKRVERVA